MTLTEEARRLEERTITKLIQKFKGGFMRAKMKVASVEAFEWGEKLKMQAVSKSTPYPPDGTDEDNTYATFTPSGTIELTITNPALHGKFKAGQKFYVDFTEAL